MASSPSREHTMNAHTTTPPPPSTTMRDDELARYVLKIEMFSHVSDVINRFLGTQPDRQSVELMIHIFETSARFLKQGMQE